MKPVRIRKSPVVALLSLAAFGCAADDAGSDVESSASEVAGPAMFVSTLGGDTLTVESFTRSADRIEGELIERNPYTHRIRYAADLGPDGTISRLEAEMFTPPENPEGPAPRRWVVEVAEGTAIVTREGGDDAGATEVPVDPGAIPSLGRVATAMYVWEQAMRQTMDADGAERPVSFIYPTRPQPITNALTDFAGDTVSMSFFGSPMLAWAEGGNLMGVSGRETTMKQEVARSGPVDMDALAAEWAARDARGEGLGIPSPAATVQTSVDGASFEVRYSQPAKRGREIWGALVPYEGVWRTGANAATHFTTDAAIELGDLAVPAGTYTLWTSFTAEGGTLIVNSETGQWGTAYNADEDFGRVAMASTSLPEVTERFTISIEDTDEGGVLHLEWDTTRFSVPIRVR